MSSVFLKGCQYGRYGLLVGILEFATVSKQLACLGGR